MTVCRCKQERSAFGVLILFNFEGPEVDAEKWGCSSAGRAPALQAGGHRFEPVHLHHEGERWKGKHLSEMYGLIAQQVRARA